MPTTLLAPSLVLDDEGLVEDLGSYCDAAFDHAPIGMAIYRLADVALWPGTVRIAPEE